MSNTTARPQEAEVPFGDTLEDLFIDCQSEDPNRGFFCVSATILGVLTGVLGPFIFTTGVIGNFLTMWVYLVSLRKKISRMNIYLSMVALADNGSIIIYGFGWQFLAKGLPWISGAKFGFFINSISDISCRLYIFMATSMRVLSANWFLALAIDRVLAMYFPFRFRTMSVKWAWRVVLLMFIVSLGLTAPLLYAFGWSNNQGQLTCLIMSSFPTGVREGFYMYTFLFVLPPLVETVLLCLADTVLLIKMILLRKERHKLSESCDTASKKQVAASVSVLVLSLCILLFGMISYAAVPGILRVVVFTSRPTQDDFQWLERMFVMFDIGNVLVLFSQSVKWIILLCRDKSYQTAVVSMLKKPCACKNKEEESFTSPPAVVEISLQNFGDK